MADDTAISAHAALYPALRDISQSADNYIMEGICAAAIVNVDVFSVVSGEMRSFSDGRGQPTDGRCSNGWSVLV